ncbi:MAG: PIN domain-containing protein [Candidatus Electrothrix sp. AW1]|nr:PIN domain-containing protein [Candidatus Electrothrix sp. AX1]MCI5183488.1 PIN domain-containing protein [Candidatus Electrothrix gigas]
MIVLDTCVFIWLGLEQEKLTSDAMSAIQANRSAISDITFLEIGYLVRKNRLKISCIASDFANLVVEAHDIGVISITPEIVETALNFSEEVNNDPADRIISATAVINESQLVTSDRNLLKAGQVPTLW